MKWMLTSTVIAALALPMLPSYAAGPFDGDWRLVAPSVVGSGDPDNPECAPLGIRFQIKDSQIVGKLEAAGNGVQVTERSGGTPITGSVTPTGVITTEWRGIAAKGQITGGKLKMSWDGACGERVGTGSRLSN